MVLRRNARNNQIKLNAALRVPVPILHTLNGTHTFSSPIQWRSMHVSSNVKNDGTIDAFGQILLLFIN